jgi:hypothetical protein
VFISVTGSVYDEAYENSERNWEAAVDELMIKNNWAKARGELGISFYAKAAKLLGRTKGRSSCEVHSWNAMTSARRDLERHAVLHEKMVNPQMDELDSSIVEKLDVMDTFWEYLDIRRRNAIEKEADRSEMSDLKDRLKAHQFFELNQGAPQVKSLWSREMELSPTKSLFLHNIDDAVLREWISVDMEVDDLLEAARARMKEKKSQRSKANH